MVVVLGARSWVTVIQEHGPAQCTLLDSGKVSR